MLTACSSSSEIEEVKNITDSTDPLTFTCISAEAEQTDATRAANTPLNTGFLVSTYKAFALGHQQEVMDKYRVEYKTSGNAWDGTVRPYWDYTTVAGQYERYWDYSNYPYRFNAIAPCPNSSASVVLNDKQLTINTPYKMQNCVNGNVSPANNVAEPYLVAQVQRNADGKDYDCMATTGTKEINTASSTLNRSVAMPFHHLNSKIRFGIYSLSPWATANALCIKDLTINVTSQKFATTAVGYNAISTSNSFTWYRGSGFSGFTGVSYDTTPGTCLLQFDGGPEVEGNDMSLHQGRSSAYWLQCQNGLMQIPQTSVQLSVSMKLCYTDGSVYKTYTDVPIKLEKEGEPPVFSFNWQSGYIHTYYLVIGEINNNLEISFTTTLAPWEDVSGSLSTDLEQ